MPGVRPWGGVAASVFPGGLGRQRGRLSGREHPGSSLGPGKPVGVGGHLWLTGSCFPAAHQRRSGRFWPSPGVPWVLSGRVQKRPLHRVPRPRDLQLLCKRLQLLACHDRKRPDVQVKCPPSPLPPRWLLFSVIHDPYMCSGAKSQRRFYSNP